MIFGLDAGQLSLLILCCMGGYQVYSWVMSKYNQLMFLWSQKQMLENKQQQWKKIWDIAKPILAIYLKCFNSYLSPGQNGTQTNFTNVLNDAVNDTNTNELGTEAIKLVTALLQNHNKPPNFVSKFTTVDNAYTSPLGLNKGVSGFNPLNPWNPKENETGTFNMWKKYTGLNDPSFKYETGKCPTDYGCPVGKCPADYGCPVEKLPQLGTIIGSGPEPTSMFKNYTGISTASKTCPEQISDSESCESDTCNNKSRRKSRKSKKSNFKGFRVPSRSSTCCPSDNEKCCPYNSSDEEHVNAIGVFCEPSVVQI